MPTGDFPTGTTVNNYYQMVGSPIDAVTLTTAGTNGLQFTTLYHVAMPRQRPPAIDLSLVNKAVGVHHTDTTDEQWDGPMMESHCMSGESESYYRKIFAWQDPDGDPATKAAWKFIHHMVSMDGEPGAANIKACQSAIGVLNGGRGGTTIPDADRQGVYNHLAAHLRDAGLEPPPLNKVDPKRAPKARGWYRFENAAEDEAPADLYIYDEIVPSIISQLFEVGTSATSMAQQLADVRGRALNVHINSPGGSVFEGLAVYNLLRGHNGPVNVYVDGIAASIASVIAMAGDTVTMMPHSMLMIHDAWGETIGNAADHEQQAAVLNKLSDNIAAVYRERGDKRVNWRAKMLAETWITDQEAVSMGLADRIGEPVSAPTNRFDLSRYRNVPECLTCQVSEDAQTDRTPTKRNAEQALRDAGFSAREAKVILASGWKDEDARDEPPSDDPDETTEITEGDETADIATGTVAGTAETEQEARARALEMMALLL